MNLSARQFREPGLPSRVAQALASSGLEPRRLTLEVTETSMVDDLGTAEATRAALRRLGVHVAVDDFGTGFSGLGVLKHYPVDLPGLDDDDIENVSS